MLLDMALDGDGSSVAVEADGAGGDHALERLLALLKTRNYRFVTPTPATHARVVARRGHDSARDLRDMLGWSLPFHRGTDRAVERLLDEAGMVDPLADGRCLARIRISSLDDELFLHSRYPTDADDAVFFGPDSYRFADLISRHIAAMPPPAGARIVDMGGGSGVGAIVAAKALPSARVAMTDCNPRALAMAAVNAAAAGVSIERAHGRNLASLSGRFDLILANPPFIADPAGRAYRDGGGDLGQGVPSDMVEAGLAALAAGGCMLLYCGAAIVDEEDQLRASLVPIARRHGRDMTYREIDPDIFGEELDQPAYRSVERIALVSASFC